jgi:MoaD family protein
MPKITVRAFAAFRELLQKRIIEIDAPVEDIQGIVDLITDTYNRDFKKTIIDSRTGQVRKGFSILVNGRDISFLDDLRTGLKDGDVVALFSPVAGG